MNFKVDWSLIKKSLWMFLSIVLLLVLSVVIVDYINDEKRDKLYSKNDEVEALQLKYLNTSKDQELYSEYVERYKALEKLGIVKGEKRLSWIESLQKINLKLKLPVLKHELFPQASVFVVEDLNAPISLNKITIKKTNMVFTAGLFHEVDLIKIFKGLDYAEGMFNVRWCGLKLIVGKELLSVNGQNIESKCLIEWYSIDVVENEE